MPRQQDLIDFPPGEQDDFKAALRRWHLDANDFEACHNLILTRLGLEKLDQCLELLPRDIKGFNALGNAGKLTVQGAAEFDLDAAEKPAGSAVPAVG